MLAPAAGAEGTAQCEVAFVTVGRTDDGRYL